MSWLSFMVLTLLLKQDILCWACSLLAVFFIFYLLPNISHHLFSLSPPLPSSPLPGTTALHGEVSTMVSPSAPEWAISLHCAPLLGKREVVLLFPVGDFLLNCGWELRSQRMTKLFSRLRIPIRLAKELLQFCV